MIVQKKFFWHGTTKYSRHPKNKLDFQEQLSKILKEVYCDCPVVKNELINREAPSAQGFGATHKLATAMVKNEAEENLGFEKFRSTYS